MIATAYYLITLGRYTFPASGSTRSVAAGSAEPLALIVIVAGAFS